MRLGHTGISLLFCHLVCCSNIRFPWFAHDSQLSSENAAKAISICFCLKAPFGLVKWKQVQIKICCLEFSYYSKLAVVCSN